MHIKTILAKTAAYLEGKMNVIMTENFFKETIQM
jgi:hypothetical protein